ncbi:MAG: AMP-binding protein [Alphaproteobacteria bacterium]|nr:AMP-binding protein [Alphaproteobacteria bacterium]
MNEILEALARLTPETNPPSLGALLAETAARKGEQWAVRCGDETRSWRDLHGRTNRIARGLALRGVKHGDYLTIALPNGIGFIEAFYAAWKIGAVPQPVSWRLPVSEMKAIVDLANSPIVIADAPFDIGRPVVSIADLLALSDDDGDLPDAVSPAWKAPTSGGSTGRPKLIVAGQPGVRMEAAWTRWRIAEDDVVLMPGPLYHNGPIVTAFPALWVGAPVVVMPRFDAEETLRLIEKHRATWVYLVPTMMSRIWRLPEETRRKYDLSSLRTVWHLAAPCPIWLKEEWIGWLGPDIVWELYGGTEGVAATVISDKEWLAHRGSVGSPTPNSEIEAFDAGGRMLPRGETGEIFMRQKQGPATYRYLGAETRALDGGWESIGDIGWVDADGYLYLADRRTDMILVGGANVYPAEVEAAIDEHPLVLSSCVIGIPDDDLGNRVHAIVQPRAGLTRDALDAHLAERLVAYKRPRGVEFVDSPLRDDAGKVRRSQLREERIAALKS